MSGHRQFFLFLDVCLSADDDRRLHEQLINSSWYGMLAALSLLLDARYLFIPLPLYHYSFSCFVCLNVVLSQFVSKNLCGL